MELTPSVAEPEAELIFKHGFVKKAQMRDLLF
jgi:hypothetical protein